MNVLHRGDEYMYRLCSTKLAREQHHFSTYFGRLHPLWPLVVTNVTSLFSDTASHTAVSGRMKISRSLTQQVFCLDW
jgi:hypothetical protein